MVVGARGPPSWSSMGMIATKDARPPVKVASLAGASGRLLPVGWSAVPLVVAGRRLSYDAAVPYPPARRRLPEGSVPSLRPFRALRFDRSSVGDLAAVVAPPYDVISPE